MIKVFDKNSLVSALSTTHEVEKTLSLTYRVLLHFKPAHCIRPYICHAYCVPFYSKNKLFGVSISTKKIQTAKLWHA